MERLRASSPADGTGAAAELAGDLSLGGVAHREGGDAVPFFLRELMTRLHVGHPFLAEIGAYGSITTVSFSCQSTALSM